MPGKRIFLAFFILLPCAVNGMDIRIGVFSRSGVTSMLVKGVTGKYDVFSAGKKVFDLEDRTLLTLNLQNDQIVATMAGNEIGRFRSLKFVSASKDASFRIKPLSPVLKEAIFDDNFDIFVTPKRNLLVVNDVDLDNYVAGVLESEIGMNTYTEFLKVQAIICRTYAISNFKRHGAEGFDLCDQVHCQAYQGKSRLNLLISLAVSGTAGKIITDKSMKPIVAAFHSNCGGETYNSEDIWPSPVPYLRSVKDTFCLRGKHSLWEQRIPVSEWKSYVSSFDKVGVLRKDSAGINFDFMPLKKDPFYIYKGVAIPVKSIRSDWKLRSPFFSIRQDRDTLLLRGRGYGHGIGMCQEGAMQMAALGYKFKDIINFYYKDVVLTDLESVKFTK